ncbi:dTMP kinase [Mesomycoplasma hyorhinis]|uniref:Thymidylate kinase n=3 Tax=Mesomycoplasma hyorhinis TaxID=2100 RepID=A0ABD6IF86_MESHY|nr:dTMP kinase [Mesomycoplasma hyorhinis]AFX74048.1 Thymidylate kinase [Mesomycoplasma hyorhinis SK76]MXR06617.1 dTMP kinase [Mesomycoplasma hyorhinis]MXR09428.1 dTMP kinase [Mesomycoplasma hyorhinis]MXR11512.1 dTMP kinase [Mesomycoplasma hyorhinis]MXR38861.1 dTMP kinase [Mesomycoplasma hyorhinis]
MFITFEGIDGSGKSTLIKKLYHYLQNEFPKKEIILTREPGGFQVREAEIIRNLLLDKKYEISKFTEVILFAASRRLHLEKLIWPSLQEGKIVISDRFIDSSIAYQAFGNEIDINQVEQLNDWISNKTQPDLTFWLDVPIQQAFERKTSDNDRIEDKGNKFFSKVCSGYEYLSKKYPERIIRIDALQNEDKVFEQIKKAFEEKREKLVKKWNTFQK